MARRLVILPDGSAQSEDIEFLEGGKAFATSFRTTMKSWIEHRHFQPEQVDGVPVSTRESYTVGFNTGSGSRYDPNVMQRLSECQEALNARDANDRQVVLDSPFHPLPAN